VQVDRISELSDEVRTVVLDQALRLSRVSGASAATVVSSRLEYIQYLV
jgi:hypothetical protein